ncbi:MAG: cache domain-containing sensor histidine kinase [Cellvibrionaceae bacterium]
MLKNLKIFPKILLNCLLIAAIPLAGFIYQIYLNEADQRRVVEQRLLQSSEVIASQVDNWVDKNIRNSKFVASMEPFKSMDATAQLPVLKAAKENLEWVSLIFVKDLKGDAVARSDGKSLRNYSDREYFKQVIAGQDIGQQVLIGKVKPVPLHCFALPIKDFSQQMAGVITQCSTLLAISDYITRSKIGQTGYAFLVDDQKRLIAHGEQSGKLVGNLQDFGTHPSLDLQSKQVATLQHDGKDRVFVTRAVGANWTLVVQQDYKEAYGNYLDAKFNAIILAAVTVIITLLLSFLISYNISTPIKKLTEITDSYSKGMFVENVVGVDRKDELGDLAKATSRMAKTIQMAISRLRKQKQG